MTRMITKITPEMAKELLSIDWGRELLISNHTYKIYEAHGDGYVDIATGHFWLPVNFEAASLWPLFSSRGQEILKTRIQIDTAGMDSDRTLDQIDYIRKKLGRHEFKPRQTTTGHINMCSSCGLPESHWLHQWR